MTQTDAILIVKRDYGNHPCGTKFCRCGWILCPPSYVGDCWDCMNPKCCATKEPTKSEIKRMLSPKLIADISAH